MLMSHSLNIIWYLLKMLPRLAYNTDEMLFVAVISIDCGIEWYLHPLDFVLMFSF